MIADLGERLALRLRPPIGGARLAVDVWGAVFGQKPNKPPDAAAQVPEWAPVLSGLGVAVRNKARSYATKRTRAWVKSAGFVAAERGGALQVSDISGPAPGPFPPHVSHAEGRDIDVAYTLSAYPTPVDVPATLGFVAVLSAMREGVEVVGVSPARKAELEAMALSQGWPMPKLSAWPGHQTHAHVRLWP